MTAKIHALYCGSDTTICGLYFLPEPLEHSNVPFVPVPKDVKRMPITDAWIRPGRNPANVFVFYNEPPFIKGESRRPDAFEKCEECFEVPV